MDLYYGSKNIIFQDGELKEALNLNMDTFNKNLATLFSVDTSTTLFNDLCSGNMPDNIKELMQKMQEPVVDSSTAPEKETAETEETEEKKVEEPVVAGKKEEPEKTPKRYTDSGVISAIDSWIKNPVHKNLIGGLK